MTSYQGGKKRLGKKIYAVIKLIEDDLLDENEELPPYFEPFVGMASVLKEFSGEDRQLYACDANQDLVCMWKALQKGWKPPKSCSEKRYKQLRDSDEVSAERCFVGCAASFGGVYFSSYRRNDRQDKVGSAYRALLSSAGLVRDVTFLNPRSYLDFSPKGATVYCDPPYAGNRLQSSSSKRVARARLFHNFDHDAFWERMRDWSRNNIVIVSESNAPSDFKKVWEDLGWVHTGPHRHTKKFPECLYVHDVIYGALSNGARRQISRIGKKNKSRIRTRAR